MTNKTTKDNKAKQSQVDKFKEIAKQLECDESEEEFKKKLQKISSKQKDNKKKSK